MHRGRVHPKRYRDVTRSANVIRSSGLEHVALAAHRADPLRSRSCGAGRRCRPARGSATRVPTTPRARAGQAGRPRRGCPSAPCSSEYSVGDSDTGRPSTLDLTELGVDGQLALAQHRVLDGRARAAAGAGSGRRARRRRTGAPRSRRGRRAAARATAARRSRGVTATTATSAPPTASRPAPPPGSGPGSSTSSTMSAGSRARTASSTPMPSPTGLMLTPSARRLRTHGGRRGRGRQGQQDMIVRGVVGGHERPRAGRKHRHRRERTAVGSSGEHRPPLSTITPPGNNRLTERSHPAEWSPLRRAEKAMGRTEDNVRPKPSIRAFRRSRATDRRGSTTRLSDYWITEAESS